jgi:O-antigen/teichoic acid export membrane protein
MPGVRRALGQRTRLSVADQAVSSLSNIALTVVVARAVAPDDFGRYVLVLATYQLLLAVNQALVSEPFLVLTRSDDGSRAEPGALGAAVGVGVLSGVVLASIGLVSAAPALVALAVLMPGLLWQDTLRFVAFGRRRPEVALASDTAWSLGQLAVTLVVLSHAHDVTALVVAWAAPGVASGLLPAVLLGVWPHARAVPAWVRASRHLAARFLGEVAATVGVFQVALYVVGWWVGLAAAGALRLAQTLFGPVNVAIAAARAAVLPELTRSLRDPRRVARLRTRVSAALAGFALLWSTALLAVPDADGARLFGATWLGLTGVLWIVALQKVLDAVGIGPFLVLRARRRATLTLGVRVVAGLLTLVSLLLLVPARGLAGAATALVLGSAVCCATWWGCTMRSATGAPLRAQADTGPEVEAELDPVDEFAVEARVGQEAQS